jgi:hypothetical protein
MKAPARACLKCGKFHWGDCSQRDLAALSSSASDTDGVAAPQKRTPAVRSDSRSGPEGGRVNVRERPMREPPERGLAPQAEAVDVTAGETAPTFEGKGTIAPKGKCEWCDRRRALNARAARDRRLRERRGGTA